MHRFHLPVIDSRTVPQNLMKAFFRGEWGGGGVRVRAREIRKQGRAECAEPNPAYYRLLDECCLLIVIEALSSTQETLVCTCTGLHEIHLNSPPKLYKVFIIDIL